MGGYKQLRVGRIDPEDDKLLEEEAVRAGTTKADMARRYIKECLHREQTTPYLQEILEQQKATNTELQNLRAELQRLRKENKRLAEIAYANLASSTWVGKQSLCAHYGSDAARKLANMFVAMSPAEVNAMFLRMGEHMATTHGDLRRAQAVICDLPGVDVRLMGYRDEEEWRAGFDADGNPIPGYVAPIPKQVEVNYDDIFYEDE